MKIKNLTQEQLDIATNILKAIAHPVRMSIVSILEDKKKLNVSEIQGYLKIEQSVASHHLGLLKDKGVLKSERVGKKIFYSLKYKNLTQIVNCVSTIV